MYRKTSNLPKDCVNLSDKVLESAIFTSFNSLWKCSGLMVSALDSRSSGLGSSPGQGHCVVLLGETLNPPSASLHPGVQMGTGEINAGG